MVLLTGCHLDMWDQPRQGTLSTSTFYEDGAAARPLPGGVVPHGHGDRDPHLYEGDVDGDWATDFPMELDAELLRRGQERYDIFCAVCHDRAGTGRGMIVQRGFDQPESFHTERLRQMPEGYYFDVITNGFGTMYPYGDRVPPEDRWAIIAYIRALQLSQDATLDDVPEDQREALNQESNQS